MSQAAINQQVNLYEAAPEANVWRDFSPLPQAGLAVLGLLIALYIYAWIGHQGLQQQLIQAQTRYDANQQRVEQLKAQLDVRDVDPALLAEVQRLEEQVKARQDLLEALDVQRIGNVEGFSHYLTGLARRHIDGLWLTQINFSDGGKRIGLQGQTGQPGAVPSYIKALGEEAVFAGVEFNLFDMESDGQRAGILNFNVTSVEIEQGGGNE